MIEGICMYYHDGEMERVYAKRVIQGLCLPGWTGRMAASLECDRIGTTVRASIQNPHTLQWGAFVEYLLVDCSQTVDRQRHIDEGLVLEVAYQVAEENGFLDEGHAKVQVLDMAGLQGGKVVTKDTPFGTEPIIDKTSLTDTRVYGGSLTPQGFILHHTGSKSEAGDYSWLSQYHANPVSVHQLLKRDGTIIQIVPMNRMAWHAGVSSLGGRKDCNSFCLGLEICNAGDGVEPFTDSQYEMVARTVAYNAARFHIPDAMITSHARVALPAKRKNDPISWDWKRMWDRVDELRAHWAYPIPLWFDTSGTRVMST